MNNAETVNNGSEFRLFQYLVFWQRKNLNSSVNRLEELSSDLMDLTIAVMGIADTLSDSSKYQILINTVQGMDDK
jgi:hypothetical protein